MITDAELARRLGVSQAAVWAARNRRDIRRFESRLNWDAQPLGLVFDPVLARSLGADAANVRRARELRGVSPYEELRRCLCGQHFLARRDGERWCSELCPVNAAHHIARRGAPEFLGVHVSLARLRGTIKRKRKMK